MSQAKKISNPKGMNDAIKQLSTFLEEAKRGYFETWLHAIGSFSGSEHVFLRIANSSSENQIYDYLAEIRYALIFAWLGYMVEFEPFGSKGPDLGVAIDGETTVVEVTRFRTMYPGPPSFDLEDDDSTLSQYGDMKRDTEKVFYKILPKLKQVDGKVPAIIAIWNDDGDLDEINIEQAVPWIREQIKDEKNSLGEIVSFIVYGSEWIGKQQFYVYEINHFPQHNKLIALLENTISRNAINTYLKQAG